MRFDQEAKVVNHCRAVYLVGWFMLFSIGNIASAQQLYRFSGCGEWSLPATAGATIDLADVRIRFVVNRIKFPLYIYRVCTIVGDVAIGTQGGVVHTIQNLIAPNCVDIDISSAGSGNFGRIVLTNNGAAIANGTFTLEQVVVP